MKSFSRVQLFLTPWTVAHQAPLSMAFSRQEYWSGLPFSSVQLSRSVMSDSLRPHESQHARPPCPSPTPRVHSNSHPLSQWCHPAIPSSIVSFSSWPQSLPASESFPMSHYLLQISRVKLISQRLAPPRGLRSIHTFSMRSFLSPHPWMSSRDCGTNSFYLVERIFIITSIEK